MGLAVSVSAHPQLFLPSKQTEQILQRKIKNPGALTQQKGLAIDMRAKKES